MPDKDNKAAGGVTPLGFLLRFIGALILVLATFNPTGESAYHWIVEAVATSSFGPLHLLLIGVLLAGWAVFGIATWRALGPLGVVIAGVIVGALIWLLVDFGILDPDTGSEITWIALIALSLLLAVGVTWSHIWRRVTGQYNVEDVSD